MAKINHNNSLDTIDELFTDAKNRGIMHLTTDIDKMSDRQLRIGNKDFLNFGTCGYLGLELDQRLKNGAIEFVQEYGTQFSVSRAYVSSGINIQLEDYLSQMFDNSPTIVYSSTSTAHISIIPTLIKYDEAVILDQQVHMSVQTAAQLLRQKGVPIEMIRHSNMEMLERLLEQLCKKHKKVWYMIDGVYSMFGDLPPMEELLFLMDKYEALHIYVDDAHGMSWHGKNGTGYIHSKAPKHPKIILVTTLAKGFGVMGGLAVFPDEETCRKVRVFGGPLGYSHPLSPPLIGSAITSAKIHLSEEIYTIQEQLKNSMNYCNELLSQTDLTVVSNPITPIYFIGMGQPKVGYNMVQRLLNDGFFVNPAIFPAVSIKNTGLRFTITRHVQKSDIKQLVDAMTYHYPKVLEEEGRTVEDVRKAFKLNDINEVKIISDSSIEKKTSPLIIQEESSIQKIDKSLWDELLGKSGSFDWDGLVSLEDVYSNNSKPEENWDFHYFIIKDSHNIPVIATFFTSGILKDDLLSLESVSQQIEEKRKQNPYYLTSKSISMGSMLTEGEHCYINREHKEWKIAFRLLLEKIYKIQETENANSVLLRDFDKKDIEIRNLLIEEGFATVNMPNSNVVDNMAWGTIDELLNTVSYKSRKHIRSEVIKNEHFFNIEFKHDLTVEEIEHFYKLYTNVDERNKSFNMFTYPKNILSKLSKHPNWKFMVLTLKPEFDHRKEKKAVAAGWCYITSTHISPMIIGIDYEFNEKYKVYKQAIYQVLKYARQLGLSKAYLGLSADFEKKKYGAKQLEKVAYLQVKDNFNMEVIESMSATVSK